MTSADINPELYYLPRGDGQDAYLGEFETMENAILASFAHTLERFGVDQDLQKQIMSAYGDNVIWTPWGPPDRGDMEQLMALKTGAKPRGAAKQCPA